MRYALLLSFLFFIASCSQNEKEYNTWNNYGGSKENIHYSSLTEIDTSNVSQLQPAWIFNTGDADTVKNSQIQCNPIIVDSIMYVTSPTLKLFALHAGTGQKIWEFDPDSMSLNFVLNNSRGVTYWTDGKNDKRIFYVASSYLHCIDATNGQLVRSFGDSGLVDLHKDLGREVQDLFVTATSPGIIYKDLYILGSRVDEGAAAAPGHIRAFDVRTGKLRWIFHTIPQPGEAGYETWEDPEAYKHIGGANSWSGFTLDEEKGILFAPTGSSSYDFYGGKRKGQNLFANCLLALDAETGKRKWHFQFIHHDLWDWDLPAPPVLVTIEKDGKKIDAVAQTTKHGMVWLFDRESGKPVYPINEMQVDTNTELIGEKVWPSQPIPTFIKPFVRQSFSANDINPYLPDSSIAKLKKDLEGYRYGKMFIPPGKKPAVELPGFDGGAEWGGPSYDPQTGLLYVNANEMGWVVTMRDVASEPPRKENYGQAGVRLYQKYCISCHGADRKGTGNFPTLINIQERYHDADIMSLLSAGRRMMPSFNYITKEEKEAIVSYILDSKKDQLKDFMRSAQPQDAYRNVPYAMTGYNKFLSPEGYPAIAPPWGTITAINLNSGEHVWKTTLGEYPELKEKGIPPTGTENYGGPVVTAGGLLFIAASRDGMIRAYNKVNGKLLWEYELPSPGFATPSVYEVNGKQFLVIACGGGKLGTRSGDAYIAFALPGKK
ncbi:MAG TPA: PQQ-binding-like beta-propeller repeat protein [Chitinophagaceae bacterium]|nr:PQQ-binding-like beta-propeller repeat protein [Chitinophagaceae bacterium]